MNTNRARFGIRTVFRIATILAVGIFPARAAQIQDEFHEASLRTFLQNYLKVGNLVDKTARYSFAATSLDDKGQSFVVYIDGKEMCGSGGCMALIVEPQGKSFKVINSISLAHLPIRVLQAKTHGWRDLVMPVRGGGVTSSRLALLKFDGRKYHSNPSTAPLAKSTDVAKGDDLPLKEFVDLVY